jgi:hypothetical protein
MCIPQEKEENHKLIELKGYIFYTRLLNIKALVDNDIGARFFLLQQCSWGAKD